MRLVQAGLVDVEDLLAPSLGARPYQESSLLALEFHPGGQAHLPGIIRELNTQVQQVGDTLLLVDWADPAAISELLYMAAEIAAPHREHIRGVIVEGPGHWTMYGIVGPLAESACKDISCQEWGKIDRIARLPAPLPPPPAAHRWWSIVAALLIATIFAINAGLSSQVNQQAYPLDANFTAGRSGIWLDFDVDDEALISIVSLENNQLHLLLGSSTAGDKAQISIGDGQYRIHAKGEGVLITSSGNTLVDLSNWIRAANQSDAPLQVLAQSIQQSHPENDVSFYTIQQ